MSVSVFRHTFPKKDRLKNKDLLLTKQVKDILYEFIFLKTIEFIVTGNYVLLISMNLFKSFLLPYFAER